MSNQTQLRLLALGLDGLPFTLAQTLSRKGKLPHLSRLALSPNARPIRAEIPELSPVNWTSFYTAAGPEEHGVFGFTRIDPVSYGLSFTDSSAVQCPTIFDRLGERGLISKVINLPNAYPAKPLSGSLIAGFVAPELSRAVYPPSLAEPLRRAGYVLEADTTRGAKDPEYLLSELEKTLKSRETALNMLWGDMNWNLFVFVLTETDRLMHFLFPALKRETHPLHNACMDFLRNWDRLIGRIIDRYDALPEPKRLLALADHGFARLKTEVDVNAWLMREGFLRLRRAPENELDLSAISPDSKAFALDPGRIYVHTKERFARGILSQTQAREVQERIQEGLKHLTFEDEPVMKRVFTREELYQGPCLAQAPDLVCLAKPGLDLKAKWNRKEIFGFFGRTGTHTVDNAFFYDTLGAKPKRIRDVGGLVLDFFGAAKQD
ncbi:MAG: alkaline phosphatase family protein [Thermodesulfobacteriota bacterium]|nr:alkaline phosphatase family protein [Thermodesulfobacteriota bacterium]